MDITIISFWTAVVMGVTQALKIMGLPKKLIPATSVLFGVAFGLITSFGWEMGIVIGLTACGLWSGTKATTGN